VGASPLLAADVKKSNLPLQGNVRQYEVTVLQPGAVTIYAYSGNQTWSSFILDIQPPAWREGPYREVNTRLADSGIGFTTHRHVAPDARYGLPETIEAVLAITRAWSDAHPGARLDIGDISLQHGGPIPGHASHQKGVDVDFWPVNSEGKAVHVSFNDPKYSRDTTQLLVNTIKRNPALVVEQIFFNDRQINGVVPWPAHDEHLHVRFKPPFELKPLASFSRKA
jgi:hypothetical protein